MTIRPALASESKQRRCYNHPDRRATFVRIEERTKPIESTVRIPQCRECADRIVKTNDVVTRSVAYPL